jgi:hypothetical protein
MSHPSPQSTEVTQGGKIEVNQVVSKDTCIVNQSGVRSSGLMNTESIVTQSAGGTHFCVTQNAIEVTAAK